MRDMYLKCMQRGTYLRCKIHARYMQDTCILRGDQDKPPGETFPQLVSFFRILGVARKNAAFECLGAIWCDMEPMVPDECMVLEKYPTGSVVYVLVPAPQFLGLACIIDIRGSGIGREVKVRFFKSRSNLELPDAWILERSRRLELFSRYHQDDEIDVVL